MFELSVALKYLIPRWRQLSVSVISLVSVLVISLVVWLIVVFFSVTDGLERSWTEKLIALTAPVRITPTDAYYKSYYYQVDQFASASNYSVKSLRAKRESSESDAYDPNSDEGLPFGFPTPDLDGAGTLIDPVKEAFAAIESIKGYPGLSANDFTTTVANLRVRLVRDEVGQFGSEQQTFLSQTSYLSSLDESNPRLGDALLPISSDDLKNLLNLLGSTAEGIREDGPDFHNRFDAQEIAKRLDRFLRNVSINSLKTKGENFTLPSQMLPETGAFRAVAVNDGTSIRRVLIPTDVNTIAPLLRQMRLDGYRAASGVLRISPNEKTFSIERDTVARIPDGVAYQLSQEVEFESDLIEASAVGAVDPRDLRFSVKAVVQGQELSGTLAFKGVAIGRTSLKRTFDSNPDHEPYWSYLVDGERRLPADPQIGDAVLLAKSFRDSGVLVGDRGYMSYFTPTVSTIQEQRIPFFVAGFYDPGVIPIGGKFVVVGRDIAELIQSSTGPEDKLLGCGINVRVDRMKDARHVARAIKEQFRQRGIAKYWDVEWYREYSFTKELFMQLQSEKNIFLLIAVIIIVVACSNIVSMLIILVNDKRLEIGILRSMGASGKSIALIFGFCGVVMGMVGSLLGTCLAVVTLRNFQSLIDLISALQGYQAFSFFGGVLPSELSYEALMFVLGATATVSLIAGVVPAVKATLMKPADILRGDG